MQLDSQQQAALAADLGHAMTQRRGTAARVVPLLQPGDRRQAAYYRSELDERMTRIAGEIAEHFVALGVFQGQGYARGLHLVSQAIR